MGWSWFVAGIVCTLAAGWMALVFIDRKER
jgi:hypothetical protein